MKSLIRKRKGCCHSSNSTTKNQSFWYYRHRLLRQRHDMGGLGDSHTHKILGFICRGFRFIGMDPGTLITDVDHLKEVPVEASIFQGFLKKRFMGPWGTGCDDHTVQLLILDGLFDLLLRILRAGIEIFRVVGHIFHTTCVLCYLWTINNRTDIDTTVADKNTDTHLVIIGYRLLFRVLFTDSTFSPLFFEDSSGKRCSTR